MESWLMAVDHVGRHARSWSYIQGSTCNQENKGKTNYLRWMLYSVYTVRCIGLYPVYAVLGVNSWSWHGEITRYVLTLCSVMTIELWTRKREMGDEHKNVVEDTSRYEKSGVRLPWFGLEDLILVYLHARSGLINAVLRMVNWLTHKIRFKSQFLIIISPISSHLSLSRHQLYRCLRTQSYVIALYLSMPWSRVNPK